MRRTTHGVFEPIDSESQVNCAWAMGKLQLNRSHHYSSWLQALCNQAVQTLPSFIPQNIAIMMHGLALTGACIAMALHGANHHCIACCLSMYLLYLACQVLESAGLAYLHTVAMQHVLPYLLPYLCMALC